MGQEKSSTYYKLKLNRLTSQIHAAVIAHVLFPVGALDQAVALAAVADAKIGLLTLPKSRVQNFLMR